PHPTGKRRVTKLSLLQRSGYQKSCISRIRIRLPLQCIEEGGSGSVTLYSDTAALQLVQHGGSGYQRLRSGYKRVTTSSSFHGVICIVSVVFINTVLHHQHPSSSLSSCMAVLQCTNNIHKMKNG
ncbi:hypothetical protein V8G54_026444, partial [Vigna mungo]